MNGVSPEHIHYTRQPRYQQQRWLKTFEAKKDYMMNSLTVYYTIIQQELFRAVSFAVA
uniref:Uncharacterized protein n=1 Tax=Arundo donax TaxID=35708 RepID=A0A0A8ZIK2_ARUDO